MAVQKSHEASAAFVDDLGLQLLVAVSSQQLSLAGVGFGTPDPIKLGDYIGALSDNDLLPEN